MSMIRSENSSLADRDADDMKSMPSSSSAERSEGFGARSTDPITYHYLTYQTPLPTPSHFNDPSAQPVKDLQPPDLYPYTDPFEWSHGRKSTLIWLSCIATMFTAYGAGDYQAGIDQMVEYWHISKEAAVLGITVFTCGFAVAPMILAPFSEINGRRPVFLVTGVLFLVFTICSAVTRLFAGMLIVRFLAGCASSTFSTMVGGVVAVLLFTAFVLFGSGLGPLVSGFMGQHTTWRWIFYAHGLELAVLVAALLIFFKETRGNVILSRKARRLNEWYQTCEDAGYYGFDMFLEGSNEKQSQRIRWKVKADEERATIAKLIRTSLHRPFHLLLTEPVVFFFSLYVSFAWAILYCTFGVLPYMYQKVYGFSLEQQGATFAAICVPAILATFISIGRDKLASRHRKHESKPENRLYFTCYDGVLLPIGLFWFGWTCSPSIHWIVPTLAVSCATMGIFSIYLATFNYLADTYHQYASSAIAAQSFCRNLMGGAFPLFTIQMFERLGFGGGASLLGGFGIVLTLVPWILFAFGPKIRARSKFASGMVTQ